MAPRSRRPRGRPLQSESAASTSRAGERVSHTARALLAIAAFAAASVAAAQQCSFTATAPETWQRVETRMASLRLPRDAYAKEDGPGDTDGVRYIADGLDVLVDYGPARRPPEPESGTTSRLLGGAPAFIAAETRADGAGRIAITWAGLGHARLEANVTIDYGDASRRADACRIASNLRLLGSTDALTLLRTGRSAGQRYAVLRDADGRERRIVEGDYVALNWGKVLRIDDRAVRISERVPDGEGRWSQRETVLRAEK